MTRNKVIGIIAIILVIVAVYTTFNKNSATSDNGQKNSSDKTAELSQTAPSQTVGTDEGGELIFTLKDLDGNTVSINELKGKKVYVNFWATWCPPCKAEMPDLEKLYQETKDSDLVILAVNVGEDAKTVKDFISKNKYSFRVLLDPDNSVSNKYNINTIPRSFFINSNGKVANMIPGMLTYDQMKEQIDQLQ